VAKKGVRMFAYFAVFYLMVMGPLSLLAWPFLAAKDRIDKWRKG
jgi:hypothetical protein